MNLQIDNSSMEAYAKCPVYYAMNRIHHYQPKVANHYFITGHAFHKLWECFFKGQPEEVIFQEFEKQLVPLNEIPDIPDSHSPNNLRRIARAWFNDHKDVKWPWKPVHIETGFKINNFIEGVDLVGRLDYLGQNNTTGDWVVMDWKTTGKLDITWERKWRASSQLCCYTWAAQQIFKIPVWEIYIMGLEIKKLPDSTRKCKEHGVNYEDCGSQHIKYKNLDVKLIADKLDDWKRDASEICEEIWAVNKSVPNIEAVKELPMKGMFNNGCYNCQYQEWCHIYNRRADVVDQLFTQEKYDPLKNVEILEVTL